MFSKLNKEKVSMSADNFKTMMESKEYTVTDTTSLFAKYENYMLKSYVARKNDYQIEFYELSNEENAISMYATNKSKFESQISNAYARTSVSMKNYEKYSLTANGKYKYLSRIDNTLIYIDANEEYKDEITNCMKEIGY